jgi:hypothetical protein
VVVVGCDDEPDDEEPGVEEPDDEGPRVEGPDDGGEVAAGPIMAGGAVVVVGPGVSMGAGCAGRPVTVLESRPTGGRVSRPPRNDAIAPLCTSTVTATTTATSRPAGSTGRVHCRAG